MILIDIIDEPRKTSHAETAENRAKAPSPKNWGSLGYLFGYEDRPELARQPSSRLESLASLILFWAGYAR